MYGIYFQDVILWNGVDSPELPEDVTWRGPCTGLYGIIRLKELWGNYAGIMREWWEFPHNSAGSWCKGFAPRTRRKTLKMFFDHESWIKKACQTQGWDCKTHRCGIESIHWNSTRHANNMFITSDRAHRELLPSKVQQCRDSESHSQAELRLSVGQLCASGPLPTSALPGRRSTAGSRTRNRSFKNHNVATVPDRNEFRIRNELKWIFRRFPKYSVFNFPGRLNWIEMKNHWIIIQWLFNSIQWFIHYSKCKYSLIHLFTP